MKHVKLLLLVWPLIYGCTECGPQKELSVKLLITGDANRLLKLSSPGASNEDIFKKLVNTELTKEWGFQLPLSLHSDSTTYIFEFESRIHTLTIFYKRSFYHKDGCGFVVDLDKPTSGSTHRSTFSSVGVSYLPYVGSERRSLFNYYRGGIDVNVRL